MPSIRGVAVFVTSPQGDDLPLYRVDAKITDFAPDPKTSTKYVEAVPRAEFCIQLAVNSNYDFGRYRALAFDITVDGKRCHRHILTREEYESGPKPWFTEISEQTWRDRDGSLRVCNLEFTKPSFFKMAMRYPYAESGTEQLCTVRVTVWGGRMDAHGDFKKGMDAEPLANFLFFYRTGQQIAELDLDRYESGGTWTSTLNRPARPAVARAAASTQQREPSEEGEYVEEDEVDARGLTPPDHTMHHSDTPLPSIEHDDDDWVSPGSSGRDQESRYGDPEDEDFDMLSSDGRDQEERDDDATRLRRILEDFDDNDDGYDDDDRSFHPSEGSSLQRSRRESLEFGRDTTPRSKREIRGVSIKLEPGDDNFMTLLDDDMEKLASHRADLLETFNRRRRELSPMEDGEHEVVKAKFERRSRIREEEKQLKRYFAREDRIRKATAARRNNRRRSTIMAERFHGQNLLTLTDDSD